jgi:hypothetical protein
MKTLRVLFAAAVVLAATTAAAPPPDPATQGWERGQAYDRQYDATHEVVMPAVVMKVEKFTPREGMAEGVRALVQGRGESTMWVHLGPAAWLVAQNIELGVGQHVVFTGSYLRLDGESVILAAKFERDGKTFRLRENNGKPAWANWHPRPA